ncbi:MAG: hypothetical protein ACOYEG_12775 [Petrimonas sp.]|jgi:hypothetical protein
MENSTKNNDLNLSSVVITEIEKIRIKELALEMKKDEKIIKLIRILTFKLAGLLPITVTEEEREKELAELFVYLSETYVSQIDRVKELEEEISVKGHHSERIHRMTEIKNKFSLELVIATRDLLWE